MNELPPDLQLIFNVGAKVYDTKAKRLGTVLSVDRIENDVTEVSIDFGTKAKAEVINYDIETFKTALLADKIVSKSRLSLGKGDGFTVKPRLGQPAPQVPNNSQSQSKIEPIKATPGVEKLEKAYINEKTGKFSKTKKKGYVQIEYRKVTRPVTLEVDDEVMEKLKEMGLV